MGCNLQTSDEHILKEKSIFFTALFKSIFQEPCQPTTRRNSTIHNALNVNMNYLILAFKNNFSICDMFMILCLKYLVLFQ